jgi:predicted nucleic acid-binding Zn ribbon protein
MRRSKTIPLSEAINDYLREMNLEGKLTELHLIESWENIVGKAISSRTSKVYIKEGILYVHLKSSVVRNELLMLREALKEKLNEKAGSQVIKDIVLK